MISCWRALQSSFCLDLGSYVRACARSFERRETSPTKPKQVTLLFRCLCHYIVPPRSRLPERIDAKAQIFLVAMMEMLGNDILCWWWLCLLSSVLMMTNEWMNLHTRSFRLWNVLYDCNIVAFSCVTDAKHFRCDVKPYDTISEAKWKVYEIKEKGGDSPLYLSGFLQYRCSYRINRQHKKELTLFIHCQLHPRPSPFRRRHHNPPWESLHPSQCGLRLHRNL